MLVSCLLICAHFFEGFQLMFMVSYSGCSHHMTGDKSLLKSLKEKVGDYVTFGDGSHAQVLGKGTVEISRLPIEGCLIHQRTEGKSLKHYSNM